MSEINLILIRHGEAAQAWGDDPDPGLSENGIDQSKLLISNSELPPLKNYKFVSSPKSRALMTASPLEQEYKKDLSIDSTFSEIPSGDIEASRKREWLTNIMKMDIRELPKEVSEWREKILHKSLSLTENTIVFTHFMVINSIVGMLIDHPNLLYFYPDYTSVTKIIIKDGRVSEFFIGGEKKTPINL